MQESDIPQENQNILILLTGATGYIGSRLLARLQEQSLKVRCLARTPDDLNNGTDDTTEVVEGDVLKPQSLSSAMSEVTTAYYLIHLMGSSANFEEQDRKAAENFAAAAKEAGVQRIIYMGGLGDESDPTLSPHLRSRHEVGKILRGSGVETIEFRASVVIGNGSLSFDLIRSLTHRLPVVICARWGGARARARGGGGGGGW